MTQRINVALPVETIRVLNAVAPRGKRSRLISDAVVFYVSHRAKAQLAAKLKQGALRNAQRDLEIAQEWFSLEEEAWRTAKPKARRKP